MSELREAVEGLRDRARRMQSGSVSIQWLLRELTAILDAHPDQGGGEGRRWRQRAGAFTSYVSPAPPVQGRERCPERPVVLDAGTETHRYWWPCCDRVTAEVEHPSDQEGER